VLCGPDGPITVFPDHQHEGEALSPAVAAADPEWPTKAGYQERAEVIAWGRVKDPSATKHGQEIGVLSAYDGHNVDVGRIVADSTWHHWFDINLTGASAAPSVYAGFDATADGQAVLKQLDAFFLNVGVWLAPPARQAEMRAAGWWSVLWDAQVVELPAKAPLWFYGDQAIDALGKRASRCTVAGWVLDWPIFKEKIPRWEWPMLFDRLTLVDIPFERYVAGGILQRLNRSFGPLHGGAFPKSAPDLREFHEEMQAGVQDGINELTSALKAESGMVARFVESGFNVRKAIG
jgi:hypothetical protein